jgi:hypothetical protein
MEVQVFCQQRGWGNCLIGGLAVQRWGEPRFTQDADFTIITGFGDEDAYLRALLDDLRLELRRPDGREFALRYRVLLAKTKGGIPIDVAFGALPFEERSVARSSAWRIDCDQSLITCSAEDLVIHKAFAGRDRDWSDVERILTRQMGKLDWPLVLEELAPLLDLKGEAESLDRLERMRRTVERRVNARP